MAWLSLVLTGLMLPAIFSDSFEVPLVTETEKTFTEVEQQRFDRPWAMTFLPSGNLLVTQKTGELIHYDVVNKTKTEVSGVPTVDYGGQGGLGDVILAPDFASSKHIYLSYVEAGSGDKRGAVVVRATLNGDASVGMSLGSITTIWTQHKTDGRGHYSHRMTFSPDGKHLFITSGDRQKQSPAQDTSNNLGTIVRVMPDGSIPADNPFVGNPAVLDETWTYGHRNLLGISFDATGQLWNNEMGPRGGDELNRITASDNYGWPLVSDGDQYSGTPIPDHDTDDSFHAPAISWNPSISPSGLIFYRGDRYPGWQGTAIMGGLSSQALIRVLPIGNKGHEAARYPMNTRIREVEEDADGFVWLLEDGGDARLMKLVPR